MHLDYVNYEGQPKLSDGPGIAVAFTPLAGCGLVPLIPEYPVWSLPTPSAGNTVATLLKFVYFRVSERILPRDLGQVQCSR